jgi:hypothetical protein
MKTDIVKNGKGHDIFVNDQWVTWVIGSKNNAEKELKTYLKK